MADCGCSGIWYITGGQPSYQGHPPARWTDHPVNGYEYDEPFLQERNSLSYLISKCDGRNMYSPQWGPPGTYTTSQYFVKLDPNCISAPQKNCTKITLGSNWVISLNPTKTKGSPTDVHRDGRLTVTSPCQLIPNSDNRYVVYIGNEGYQFQGQCQCTITYVDCNTTPGTYDCINGQCVKNSENNGYYASLDLCQDNCGAASDPKKICFTKAEYSAIVSKLNAIQGRVCG